MKTFNIDIAEFPPTAIVLNNIIAIQKNATNVSVMTNAMNFFIPASSEARLQEIYVMILHEIHKV